MKMRNLTYVGAKESSAVPEGLESSFHFTQHSSFGCVLGYHVAAPAGLIL
jgi:hypothetical protein